MNPGLSSAGPDRYAVIGNPVAHSRSPDIHAAFAAQTGQSLVYERLLAPLDGFVHTLQAFADGGGRGCNITVPFKFEVPALAHATSERVDLAQAANTLRLESGRWWADNTDGVGLVADLQVHAQRPLQHTTVLLLGAGGAAAGVLGPLLEARPARLVVLNRTAEKAASLARRHAACAARWGVALEWGGLEDAVRALPAGADVLINGTASSLAGGAAPVSSAVLRAHTLAVDMMYGPAAQGFIDWARHHGAQPRDGLGMLVEQAAAAFALWRGVRPDTAPVLAALRQTVDRH